MEICMRVIRRIYLGELLRCGKFVKKQWLVSGNTSHSIFCRNPGALKADSEGSVIR